MAISIPQGTGTAATVSGVVTGIVEFLARYPTALLALTFRIAVAVVFWRSGLSKIASWDTTVALFEMEYMLPILPPELGALLATSFELACPVLLVFGLGTRVAAALLLGMTAVIQLFVYPENWPDHLLWAAILVYLLTRGAGAVSLDRVIAHQFRMRASRSA